MKKNKLHFFSCSDKDSSSPLLSSAIAAGFPSPADDYLEGSLDLNKQLIQHPASTFLVRVEGSSMIDARIQRGDILVVDKSLEAKDGSVIIAILNGDFTVKRLVIEDKRIFLKPENKEYSPIEITADTNFEIWGVVTYIIHKAK
jgi:DNA polymerase V